MGDRIWSARALVACATAVGAILLAGCQSTAPAPTCDPAAHVSSDAPLGAPIDSMCQMEHTIYEVRENRSFGDKLKDGDRDTWLATLFVPVGALGVLWILSLALRAIGRGSAAQPAAPFAAQPPPPPFAAQPPPPPPLLNRLIGARVTYRGGTFQILDDTAGSVEPARRSGGRTVVTAADAEGVVGLLFLGFAADGTLIEASTPNSPWDYATLL